MTEAISKPEPQASALAIMKTDVVDVIADRVNALIREGELHLPEEYSAPNAIKAAWLALQAAEDRSGNKALEVCTKGSVANALLDMVIQGLNPSKKQCYFIVFGNQLQLMRSYFGTVALLRRVYPDAQVHAELVYGADEFAYELDRGRKIITKHVQRLENIDERNVIAAYCVIELGNGQPDHVEIMMKDQIERAWGQGAAKGNSPAHKRFGGEMAKKTVINRAAKLLINSSGDQYLVRAIERQGASVADARVEETMLDDANKAVLAIPEATTEHVLAEPIVSGSLAVEHEAGVPDVDGAVPGPRERLSAAGADAAVDDQVDEHAAAEAAVDMVEQDEAAGHGAEFDELVQTWELDPRRAVDVAVIFAGGKKGDGLTDKDVAFVLANRHEFLKRYEQLKGAPAQQAIEPRF